MPPTAMPGPIADSVSQFFWDALREEKVLLQRCTECARARFPPMSHCPYCRSPEFHLAEIPGTGEIYSWVVVRRAFAPEFLDDIPYTIATVDFDGDVRAAVRVEDSASIDFGTRVEATFRHHESWSELRVRPMN